MIPYGLVILPLIQDLRTAHLVINQPWYADYTGSDGAFKGIHRHLDYLVVRGASPGYFLEPTKIILVVSPQNVPRAEGFFRGYRLEIVIESRYLEGFMGAEEVQALRLENKVGGWQYLVEIVDRVVCKHPYTAYVGLQKSLQQEWVFLQRITLYIGKAFHPVEDTL